MVVIGNVGSKHIRQATISGLQARLQIGGWRGSQRPTMCLRLLTNRLDQVACRILAVAAKVAQQTLCHPI